ncbi:MAG TPA: hypothetical protein VME63_05415 [Dyella sp.]|uniref:hypothetical protein n=1 Tax=Dyella sp. TaxID=1869338 RepID=UPI002C622C6D|nr:hypothetical protein [Dyella sp.]HTV84820.1 hypothetical protein [Dyella sp.]
MNLNDPKTIAVLKLIEIYGTATDGTKKQLEIIGALGAVGGEAAVEKLIQIRIRGMPEINWCR